MIAQLKKSPETATWSVPKRILFRFLFCYLTLYMLPSPGKAGLLEFIPGSSALSDLFDHGWKRILPWFAVNCLHLTGPTVVIYRQSGTSDKTLDYVLCVLLVFIAIAVSVGWSLVDSKRSNYVALDSCLRMAVRYYLILYLASYRSEERRVGK